MLPNYYVNRILRAIKNEYFNLLDNEAEAARFLFETLNSNGIQVEMLVIGSQNSMETNQDKLNFTGYCEQDKTLPIRWTKKWNEKYRSIDRTCEMTLNYSYVGEVLLDRKNFVIRSQDQWNLRMDFIKIVNAEDITMSLISKNQFLQSIMVLYKMGKNHLWTEVEMKAIARASFELERAITQYYLKKLINENNGIIT